jgi:hypothetical protein
MFNKADISPFLWTSPLVAASPIVSVSLLQLHTMTLKCSSDARPCKNRVYVFQTKPNFYKSPNFGQWYQLVNIFTTARITIVLWLLCYRPSTALHSTTYRNSISTSTFGL